jgi:hypothetical protein
LIHWHRCSNLLRAPLNNRTQSGSNSGMCQEDTRSKNCEVGKRASPGTPQEALRDAIACHRAG